MNALLVVASLLCAEPRYGGYTYDELGSYAGSATKEEHEASVRAAQREADAEKEAARPRPRANDAPKYTLAPKNAIRDLLFDADGHAHRAAMQALMAGGDDALLQRDAVVIRKSIRAAIEKLKEADAKLEPITPRGSQ